MPSGNRPRSFLIALFVAAWGASLAYHVTHRGEHFQEVDSFLPYYVLHDVPAQQIGYGLMSYGTGRTIGETPILGWLNAPWTERNVLGPLAARYPYFPPALGDDPLGRTRFLRQLIAPDPKLHWHFAWRSLLMVASMSSGLPNPLMPAFLLPYGSTYFPGMGLIYGFLAELTGRDFERFLLAGTLLTQILFHLSALFLFGAVFLFYESVAVAGITMLLFLGSMMNFEYGYHLGSTVWIAFTSTAWIFLSALPGSDERRRRRVAWATAALVYFNYLILFYWAAFLLAEAWRSRGVRALASLGLGQAPALLSVAVCGALFVQPGQGVRSFSSESTRSFFYSLLNLFSWAEAWPAFQFWLFLSLIVAGFCSLVEAPAKRVLPLLLAAALPAYGFAALFHNDVATSPLRLALFCVLAAAPVLAVSRRFGLWNRSWFRPAAALVVFLLLAGLAQRTGHRGLINYGLALAVFGTGLVREVYGQNRRLVAWQWAILVVITLVFSKVVVALAPARHLMFASAPLFLLLAGGLRRLPIREEAAVVAAASLVLLGAFTLPRRSEATVDYVQRESIPSGVDALQTDAPRFAWKYRTFPQVEPARPAAAPPFPARKPGATYLYVSQLNPFLPPPGAIVLEQRSIPAVTKFLPFDYEKLAHNRPNGLYWAKFTYPKP